MPATAGRVRMPANNRVHSSAALQTHGIWQSAIGYDPYAPTTNKDSKPSDHSSKSAAVNDGGDEENAYASFQGLLALARITGTTTDETRGACKKCGRVGHLTFQCRNFLSVREDKGEDDDGAALVAATAAFDKIKKANGKNKLGEGESSEEEEDESESSDSDVDPEIEKIIAARSGKKMNKRVSNDDSGVKERKSSHRRGRSKKRSGKRSSRSDDDDEDVRKEKRVRRRKSHRGSDDDDEEGRLRHRKSRKERKRRRGHRRNDESGDESEEESDGHKRHKPRNRRDDSGSKSDCSKEASGGHKQSKRHRERQREKRPASSSGSESNSSDEDASRFGREKRPSEKRSKNNRRD